MITKLPVLGFSLVTALSAPALAHEDCDGPSRAPVSYGGPRQWGPHDKARRDRAPRDIVLTRSDNNRDGWISLEEALHQGRLDFRRSDRDHNRVLNRREMERSEIQRHDRDRDGRLSFVEHQRAVRAHFERLDRNRDGYLTRYEADTRYESPVRTAGWRR